MPDLQSSFEPWSPPLFLTFTLVILVAVYGRGWFHLHSVSKNIVPPWRAASFLAGVFLIWIALGSPLATFDDELLTVHMIQHLLLLTIAPALILLGSPVMPLLHGLSTRFVGTVLGPISRSYPLQRIAKVVTHPAFCWLAATSALVLWHVPSVFTAALHSEVWHMVEHLSFLSAGFLFWWPVIQPWPSVPVWSGWSILLYLFLATLPCDILSAFLVFSERVVYPIYFSASRHFSLSVLQDQVCAGALMWTCVTIVYLFAAAILTIQLLGFQDSKTNEFVPLEADSIPSPTP
jgi:putative membrane protein